MMWGNLGNTYIELKKLINVRRLFGFSVLIFLSFLTMADEEIQKQREYTMASAVVIEFIDDCSHCLGYFMGPTRVLLSPTCAKKGGKRAFRNVRFIFDAALCGKTTVIDFSSEVYRPDSKLVFSGDRQVVIYYLDPFIPMPVCQITSSARIGFAKPSSTKSTISLITEGENGIEKVDLTGEDAEWLKGHGTIDIDSVSGDEQVEQLYTELAGSELDSRDSESLPAVREDRRRHQKRRCFKDDDSLYQYKARWITKELFFDSSCEAFIRNKLEKNVVGKFWSVDYWYGQVFIKNYSRFSICFSDRYPDKACLYNRYFNECRCLDLSEDQFLTEDRFWFPTGAKSALHWSLVKDVIDRDDREKSQPFFIRHGRGSSFRDRMKPVYCTCEAGGHMGVTFEDRMPETTERYLEKHCYYDDNHKNVEECKPFRILMIGGDKEGIDDFVNDMDTEEGSGDLVEGSGDFFETGSGDTPPSIISHTDPNNDRDKVSSASAKTEFGISALILWLMASYLN